MTKEASSASRPISEQVAKVADDTAVKISKIDVARRQLTEAIRLWLDDRDILAVHTLTMASFGILYGLCNREPRCKEQMHSILSDIGYSHYFKLANFLKHADRDPLATIEEPNVVEIEARLGFCAVMYRMQAGHVTPEMGAFHLMSLMTYPDNFNVVEDKDTLIELGAREGAEIARGNVAVRRELVGNFLKLMNSGEMNPNVDVGRKR